MLAAAGCSCVLVGHSERRQVFGDDDALVRRKVEAVLREGMIPILCVGETLAERDAGDAEAVVGRQLEAGAGGLPEPGLAALVIAYEPVWAIGTGRTATPETAETMAAAARRTGIMPLTFWPGRTWTVCWWAERACEPRPS